MPINDIKVNKVHKPIVLVILDGWGLSPSWGGNTIAMSNPTNINALWREFPHTVLQAFKPVAGEIGNVANSEIGHASIGTGRMVDQDLNDINHAIKKGLFNNNVEFTEAIDFARNNNGALHLVGMISDGGVHSHIKHLYALLDMAKAQGFNKVFIHAITDGVDTEPNTAAKYITELEKKIKSIGIGQIATICGRYWSMDKDNHWDRISTSYRAMVFGKGVIADDPNKAIMQLYKQRYTDTNLPPTVITKNKQAIGQIKNGDSLVFFNFRPDRIRELVRAFKDKEVFHSLVFRKFPLLNVKLVTLTDYRLKHLDINVAFPSAVIESSLAKIFSDHGLHQLHVGESEKYAHVTYFFNGGREEPYANEDRIIIPSTNFPYEQRPEMQTPRITEKVVQAIKSKKYDFIILNIANVDMVGHSGSIEATVEAINSADKSVGIIVGEALKADGMVIITADHGNAEQMVSLKKFTRDPETIHSLNPVPFIMVSKELRKNLMTSAVGSSKFSLDQLMNNDKTVADIAPTILNIMGMAKPTDMTGQSLLGDLE